jgi:hypothetical protein
LFLLLIPPPSATGVGEWRDEKGKWLKLLLISEEVSKHGEIPTVFSSQIAILSFRLCEHSRWHVSISYISEAIFQSPSQGIDQCFQKEQCQVSLSFFQSSAFKWSFLGTSSRSQGRQV